MTRALTSVFAATTTATVAVCFSVSLAVAGCGASPGPGASDAHEHGHDHEHDDGDHHHPHFTGGMKDFHDVLAPAYHMDKGPARDEKTCAGIPAMQGAAAKVAGEPKGDAASFQTKATALTQSVEALSTACGVAGKADVNAKLESVHEAFHALMEHPKGLRREAARGARRRKDRKAGRREDRRGR